MDKKKQKCRFTYSVFGSPVAHSLSLDLMNYFQRMVKKKRKDFWIGYKCNDRQLFKKLQPDFCNFTTPYKVQGKQGEGSSWDNFNTYSKYSDKYINTDYIGIYYALQDFFPDGKSIGQVFVIGTGKAAWSACKALNMMKPKEIKIFYHKNHDEDVLKRFDCFRIGKHNDRFAIHPLSDLQQFIKKEESHKNEKSKQIIINCSDQDIFEGILNRENIPDNLYIMDSSYLKMPLQKYISKEKYINPLRWFYYQGFIAFLFFNNSLGEIPGKKINRAIRSKYQMFESFLKYKLAWKGPALFFLTGFMGSGKTSVSEKISRVMGWNQYDIDEEIEKKEKNKISIIFKNKGEKYFRLKESGILQKTVKTSKSSKQKAVFISGGGGIYNRRKNRNLLRKNSLRIYLYIDSFRTVLKRISPLNEKEKRPLTNILAQNELKELFDERKTIYLENCDIILNGESKMELLTGQLEKELAAFLTLREKWKASRMDNKNYSIMNPQEFFPVIIPPSKSESIRLLLLSGFQNKTMTIKNISLSDDLLTCRDIMVSSGVRIKEDGNEWIISGIPIEIFFANLTAATETGIINCRESGFCSRVFIMLSLFFLPEGKRVYIQGEKTLLKRPMHMFEPYVFTGCLSYKGNPGYLPVSVDKGIDHHFKKTKVHKLSGNLSSQHISGLFFSYYFYEKQDNRKKVPPYLLVYKEISTDFLMLTRKILGKNNFMIKRRRIFNYSVYCFKNFREQKKSFFLQNGKIEWNIHSDLSLALYFIVFGMIKKRVILDEKNFNKIQNDFWIIKKLKRIGLNFKIINGNYCEVIPVRKIRSFSVSLKKNPDFIFPMVILALYSCGTCFIRNVDVLKFKESDRLSKLVNELKGIGAKIIIKKSRKGYLYLKINPGPVTFKSQVEYFQDHRIAMGFHILNKINDNQCNLIKDSCVKKSFPDFYQQLEKI